MARTSISPNVLVRQQVGVSADAADLSWGASDSANGNAVPFNARLLVFARNDDVGAQTITIAAPADPFGRTGSIDTYSLDADEEACFGYFEPSGWKQADGTLWIDTSDNNVKLLVYQLP